LVGLSHPLAAVQGENNAILVQAVPAGDLMFYGKGAGPGPAASAVAGDVLMLARELLGETPPARGPALAARLVPARESVSSFYIRLHVVDRPGVLASIAQALGRRRISIASIHQPEARTGERGVPVVITTHPARTGDFRAALRDVLALAAVSRRHAVMRILS
jgi:homoserine dehydrogenase